MQDVKGKQGLLTFPKTALTKNIVKYLYYMEGYTLEEIGNMFGITRERVRQLMDKWGLRRFKDRNRK